MTHLWFFSAPRNAWIRAGSLPAYTTLKFSFRFLISASSLVTKDGSPSRNWPCPPDSEVLNWLAYLLRFFQLRTSGCALASHGGTYQPMMPLLPFGPASTAVLLPWMYFLTRSGCPQFSMTTSTCPLPKPCQEISSLRSL